MLCAKRRDRERRRHRCNGRLVCYEENVSARHYTYLSGYGPQARNAHAFFVLVIGVESGSVLRAVL